VEARITDAGNREISGVNSAIATYGGFLVNVPPEQYGFMPGARGAFNIEARGYAGKPVTTAVSADLLERLHLGDKPGHFAVWRSAEARPTYPRQEKLSGRRCRENSDRHRRAAGAGSDRRRGPHAGKSPHYRSDRARGYGGSADPAGTCAKFFCLRGVFE